MQIYKKYTSNNANSIKYAIVNAIKWVWTELYLFYYSRYNLITHSEIL